MLRTSAVLAPEPVVRAARAYAEATEELGKQIQAAGRWDGAQIGAWYDLWKQAEQDLIDAARAQLGASQLAIMITTKDRPKFTHADYALGITGR